MHTGSIFCSKPFSIDDAFPDVKPANPPLTFTFSKKDYLISICLTTAQLLHNLQIVVAT